MALPLQVVADLALSVDGTPFKIEGDGDRLVVRAARLRDLRALRTARPLRTPRSMSRLAEALTLAGITLEVHVANDCVAQLGAGASPADWVRLLDVGPVDVQPMRVLRSAVRRHPIAAGLGGASVLAGVIVLVRRLLRSED